MYLLEQANTRPFTKCTHTFNDMETKCYEEEVEHYYRKMDYKPKMLIKYLILIIAVTQVYTYIQIACYSDYYHLGKKYIICLILFNVEYYNKFIQ